MSLRNLIIALVLFTAVKAFPAEKPSIPTKLAVDGKNSYSTLPLFSIFKPIIELFPSLTEIGPKIEIGDKYTNIIIKAEQHKLEDFIVEVKGRYVNIGGSKKTVYNDRDLSSEFLYTASLPTNANTSDVFAKFYSDNYLIVTTPNKGLNNEVVYVDRIVPIIISNDKYINADENHDQIQDTTVPSETVTEDIKEMSTTIFSIGDPLTTTSVPEVTTEVTMPETKEATANSVTAENPQASFDVTTNSISCEEKEATADSEDQTTPYIEAVTQNTTPYIDNEISDLEPITSSI